MTKEVQLPTQLDKFLQNATKQELETFQWLVENPDYEQKPVTMQEFLDNDFYTGEQDKPRPKNRQILIDFFDGGYEELLVIAGIGCIASGTTILTSQPRPIRIEKIKPGQKIYNYNGVNPVVDEVTDVVFQGKKEVFEVSFDKILVGNNSAAFEIPTIKATANHPFFTRKGWVRLDCLKPGHEILRFSKNLKETWVKVKEVKPAGIEDTWDLTIKNNPNFFANGLVVHNSGKSYLSSMAISYTIHTLLCLKNPQKFFNFARGTKIAFINISTSLAQASNVVFTEIKNRIDNNAWFQAYYPPDYRVRSKLKFPKNIFILPLGSNEEAPLGYNIYGGIIDEASFHTQTKDKDYAEYSYDQIKARMKSRFMEKGKLFTITSPKYVYDFAEKKFSDDNNPKLYKIRYPIWEAMPPERYSGAKFDIGQYLPNFSGLMVPIEYQQEFIRNPEKAMRDLGAQPSLSIQGFFRDSSVIRENANKEREHSFKHKNLESPCIINKESFQDWFKEDDYNNIYHCHTDLALNRAGKGDYAGFAMGRLDGWETYNLPNGNTIKRPKIYISLMLRIKAKTLKDEIQFDDIKNLIFFIKDYLGFNIRTASFDGFQSVQLVQSLNDGGIKASVLSVDRTLEPYYTMKEAILEKRLDYYAYTPFIEECETLEEVKGNKVDHPRGLGKDVADAVCGVVFEISKSKSGTGVLGA
jgi:hypothetical protein